MSVVAGLTKLALTSVAGLLVSGCAGQTANPTWAPVGVPPTNAVPDEATAVSVAVAVLNGGMRNEARHSPEFFTARLVVEKGEEVWVVSEAPGAMPSDAIGGIPIVVVRRRDAQIVSVLRLE